MKIFGDYLRRHLGGIGILLACCGIFVLVFSLYDLPAEAVLYGGVLSAVLYLFWFLVRFRKYYQKCRTLRQMQQELTQEWRVRYSDMIEYYTAWTHQMKTPIAAMRLHLQAADTPENHMLLEDLQRIEQYVEMVLCYLRLDSDSTDYLFVQCDLDSIVRQAVRRFSAQFIHRKIRLEYEPLDCQVLTDEKWLLFVLEQVLSNALKYTPSGGTVSIFLEEPKTLCIRDTGIGIAAEDLPRIFEKGFTGCNGRTDKKASGIGLYLCRRICRNLNHTITAESQAEQGTTIRIGMFRETRGIE